MTALPSVSQFQMGEGWVGFGILEGDQGKAAVAGTALWEGGGWLARAD